MIETNIIIPGYLFFMGWLGVGFSLMVSYKHGKNAGYNHFRRDFFRYINHIQMHETEEKDEDEG